MSTEGRGGAGSVGPRTALPSRPTRPAPARLHRPGLTAVHSQAPPGSRGAVGRGGACSERRRQTACLRAQCPSDHCGLRCHKAPGRAESHGLASSTVSPWCGVSVGLGSRFSLPVPPPSLVLLPLTILEAAVPQGDCRLGPYVPPLWFPAGLWGPGAPRPTLGARPLPSRKQETSLP